MSLQNMSGRDHATAFLARLHPASSARALIRFVALPARGAPIVRWHWDPACVGLDEILELNTQGYAAYVQVNPCAAMIQDGGGFVENVAYVHALPIDIDAQKSGVSASRLLALLNEAQMPPTIAVRSGNGGHFYYCLDRPYTLAESAGVSERLCTALFSDAIHNPNRVMRLPGSVNWKTPPSLCYLESTIDRRYSLAEITTWLDAIGAPRIDDEAAPGELPPVVVTADIATLIARMPARLAETVRTGIPPAGATDMSKLDWAVMRALAAVGATDDQIAEIYARFPVGGIKASRSGQAYFERTLARARADVLSDLADRSVDEAILQTGLFTQHGDGTVAPDLDAIRATVRAGWGLESAERAFYGGLQGLSTVDLRLDKPPN